MFLQKRTKKGLQCFQTFLITSLLVIIQIAAPIQAVYAIDAQKTETLTKDLAIAAISEKQAAQYAVDQKKPDNLDFSDQQKIELSRDSNDHYFFIQNSIKETADQTTTEISIPKGYEYNEALTEKMNAGNTTIHFTYNETNHLLSIEWTKNSTEKSAVLALSGYLMENSSIYARSVGQDTVFRSNELCLINKENVPSSSSSDSSSDSSSNESTNETTSSPTSTTSAKTSATKEETERTSTETTNEQTTMSSEEKTSNKPVKSSSLNDYDWQDCAKNEFLSARSPINPNYYNIIGFGGLKNLGKDYKSLKETQEQMFVIKASEVSNPSVGPTPDEIKNSAIGYLYNGGTSYGWDGLDSQGIEFTVGLNKLPIRTSSMKIQQLQKATSEDGLPMLRAISTIKQSPNIQMTVITTLKILSNGRVAHYITLKNISDETVQIPHLYRELHTWLAGEHMTQTYAIGDNKGMYLNNTVNDDGTLAYPPVPSKCKDPYKIEFPVDGYPGQPDNWMGSAEKNDSISSPWKDKEGGDERFNYPEGYNLLTPSGTGASDRDGGIYFRWNDITVESGESKDFRYDTSLTPLGTLKIDAEKTYKNETSTDGKNHVSDQLLFDLKAKNASKQIWTDGSIIDVLPEGLIVDTSSFVFIGADGKEISLAKDIYDASTRSIKVKLPDNVNPEEEVHVKFKATLDKSTAEKTITNTMQAIDASGNSTPDSVDIKVEKADGPLTLDSVPNLDFGLNSIATKDTTYDAYAMKSEDTHQYVPNYAQISDQRADHTGWTLAVAQTNPFTADSGATLGPNTILTLTNQKVSGTTTGAVPPSFLANTVTLLPNNEAQIVCAAAANEGDGTWKSIWGTVATEKRYTENTANPNAAPILQDTQVNKGVQLMVPGQVKKVSEQYVTNLDWVLSDTPAPLKIKRAV
jgi:hypothetical protein